MCHTISKGPTSIPNAVLLATSRQTPKVHFHHFQATSGRCTYFAPFCPFIFWQSVGSFVFFPVGVFALSRAVLPGFE